jgi:hypothetical protein
MPTIYVSGNPPPAELDTGFLLARLDQDGLNVAMHVSTDPISGAAIFSLYTEDGHGNGGCIVCLPLAELRDAAKAFNQRLNSKAG